MNKELIHSRFAKSIGSYNDNAKIQKLMSEKLITLPKKKYYSKILEIGCGTGFLTKLTAKTIDFQNYKAIDIVAECESYIKQISPKINFVQFDIEEYLNTDAEKYDLIISNASLQWVNDFEGVINTLKNRLNPNGELVFSTFGTDNFQETSKIFGTCLKYYTANELETLFGGETTEEHYTMVFNSPKDVLSHIKLTGVNSIESKHWTKKDLQTFEKKYSDLCGSKPTLTYNPIYFQYIFCPIG